MNSVPEEFKAIPNFPGYYINKVGKVWSGVRKWRVCPKFLKPTIDKDGYLRVRLSINTKPRVKGIHQLLLETFVGPCPIGFVCRHLNGNPRDNKLNNLVWGTRSENNKDAHRHGTVSQKGEKNRGARLNELRVRIIKRLLKFRKEFTLKELGKIFSVSRGAIECIRRGQSWKHL